MAAIHRLIHHSYVFGCKNPLSTRSLELLTNIFSTPPSNDTAMLEGRAAVRFTTLPETGPVAIKAYKRGGLISRMNKDKYFKLGQLRSQREFDFLIAAQRAGVRVPVPVAYAATRSVFYNAWLITEKIKGHQSFAGLCQNNPEKALTFLPAISRSIACLIRNKIHHIDLHPGNIILDDTDTVFVIDFDKASWYKKNDAQLAAAYQNRWARAVHKYNLPSPLSVLELT
ncbi:MAG: hypothetical protein CSA29_02775 [Desulfobacterales bacterium]|nr:MAG: hypothetical protein CSA29_02775 [Desulfobacterales bacterium]